MEVYAHKHLLVLIAVVILSCGATTSFKLSPERIVFQTKHGDIEMALYPEVAPVTSTHIMALAKLGAYNTIDFFRVDRGFVAQCLDVAGNRKVPLNAAQAAEAAKKVPLEVRKDVKHNRRGILSMARWDDPNSGGSSFSITLGAAPHLDMKYAIFGEVTSGLETLDKFEQQPTKKEGIFVMPVEPITIQSSYVYVPGGSEDTNACGQRLELLQQRFDSQSSELQKLRSKQLPGT
eukprot:CAMPEP_0206139598 /NCGR_PEP_ID=MMETSP1473-20131121/6662_1 /ASSEMBLY_ACC=CAM_ASM_001109 /TAXON_ID=1461547 /ORGANISM="Stichococcus sp, Strain RCC1054" /LENGTH=233 /DNA_ID=CAMNT_0053533457 /DNA_START=231 /DNA_END=932 /DNA_ORIENTATION=+